MPSLRAWRVPGLAGLVLLLLTLLFWKLRILDTGVNLELTLENVDLYDSHYPMTGFGFGALREGRLPLWNPWQFVGEPFLAAYYGGLFYPLNAIYLVTSVPLGMELSGVLHMALAAGGMAALARRLRIDWPGALVAAFSFAWSGWFVFSTNQPRILAAIAWLPWTLWLVDRVFAGERRAGARPHARRRRAAADRRRRARAARHAGRRAARRAAVGRARGARRLARRARARGAVRGGRRRRGAAHRLPAAPDRSSWCEQSARSAGGFDVAHAIGSAFYTSALFLRQAAEASGWVTVGVLPLVAAWLALGRGRGALPWLLGAAAALIGAQLVLRRRAVPHLPRAAFRAAVPASLQVPRPLRLRAGAARGARGGKARRQRGRDAPRAVERRALARRARVRARSLLYSCRDAGGASPGLAALRARARRLRRSERQNVAAGGDSRGSSASSSRACSSALPTRSCVPVQRPEALAAPRELFAAARARGDQCARLPVPASVVDARPLAQAGHAERGGRLERLRAARAGSLQGVLRRRLALALARRALQRALSAGGGHRTGVCST